MVFLFLFLSLQSIYPWPLRSYMTWPLATPLTLLPDFTFLYLPHYVPVTLAFSLDASEFCIAASSIWSTFPDYCKTGSLSFSSKLLPKASLSDYPYKVAPTYLLNYPDIFCLLSVPQCILHDNKHLICLFQSLEMSMAHSRFTIHIY